jgi:hypothetical protein
MVRLCAEIVATLHANVHVSRPLRLVAVLVIGAVLGVAFSSGDEGAVNVSLAQ